MATLAISGVLSSSIGWPSVFYLSGFAGIGWLLLWILLGSSSPADNTLMSTAERQYIYDNVQHDVEGDTVSFYAVDKIRKRRYSYSKQFVA